MKDATKVSVESHAPRIWFVGAKSVITIVNYSLK